MAATLTDSYKAIANLNLWFKNRSGDTLFLSDVPSILPLRWTYFKNSWEYIKPDLIRKVKSYSNPDFFNQQIIDFSAFIDSQRNSGSKVNPFSDAVILNKYYTIFDNIEVTSIQLNNEENRILQATIAQVATYSKNDFLKIKYTLRDYRDRYADTVALSDPDYNQAYNKSSIPAQIDATITDANYMLSIQQGIKSVDFVLANFFATDAAVDPFALARANANNPDIDIGQYSSGRLVKMDYGQDLQQMAYKYLGDPNKWLDIAIANGLKPPYIDEVGERVPLLSNAQGSQINIAGTDVNGNINIDKFYINQVLFIKSDIEVVVDQRKILNIRQIPVSDEIIIELDGDADLAKYQIADNAHIRVFKPNTINSGFYVLIPSSDPLSDPRREDTPWFLADASDDEKQQKIDFAVDDAGDLIFSPNGDLKFSYGLDNAIQGIKFKIQTEVGSLRYHPNYGIVNIMGRTNANIQEVKSTISDSIIAQIESDPRYERVEGLNVQYDNKGVGASSVVISMAVRLAGGGDKVIPISFTVNI